VATPDFNPITVNQRDFGVHDIASKACDSFGTLSFPSDGSYYKNNTDEVFLIIPESTGPREIAFTHFDIEDRDFVGVHVWENNQFRLVDR